MENLNAQLTELFDAIQRADICHIKRLLAANVSPTQCSSDGQTALTIAAQTGNAQIMQLLCQAATNRPSPAHIFFRAETNDATVAALTDFQQTKASTEVDLHLSQSKVKESYPSLFCDMVFSISSVSNPPSPTFTSKTTPITSPTSPQSPANKCSADKRPAKTVAGDADLKSPTAKPQMPTLVTSMPNFKSLELAVHQNDVDTVKALLKAGVSFRPTHWYDTPLLVIAAQKGHEEIVQALINAGANVHIGYDQLPLHAAAANGHVNIAKRLLNSGAYIHATTDGGRTALMEATAAGHYQVVELLLANGANVNAACQGETALMLAAKGHYRDVYELLYPYVPAAGRIPFSPAGPPNLQLSA